MVTFLVTSFFLIAAAASYAAHRRQRAEGHEPADNYLPPPRHGGLFGGVEAAEEAARLAAEEEKTRLQEERAAKVLSRARAGDFTSLREAKDAGGGVLYDEALNALTARAYSDDELLALASFVAEDGAELRANRALAERLLGVWRQSPARGTTAKLLHVAALTGEAAIYREAVEAILQLRREGRVAFLTVDELCALVESESRLLPAHERSSGAGFVLKQTIARLRRESAEDSPPATGPTPNRR